MAVLSSRALHEQLSVIMDALTKAAVAEICQAVQEGYALLQLELTRSHKENQDLKKKLHLIESIVARGSGGGGADHLAEVEVAPAADGAQQPETLKQQLDGDGGEAAAVTGGGDGAAAGLRRDELPDVVLIKDEDSDGSDAFDEDNRPADGAAASREGVPSSPHRWHAKRHREDHRDAEMTSSSEQLAQKASRLSAGTKAVSAFTLDSPHSELSCSGPLRDEVESVCSYSSHVDPDVHVVQDCSLGPPSSNRPAYFSSSSSVMLSPSHRAEVDLTVEGPGSFAQFSSEENVDGDSFGLKLVSVSGSTSTDCQLSESSSSAYDYEDATMMNFTHYRDQLGRSQLSNGQLNPGAQGKRFLCSICNKTYATSQNLDVHMRIHTGQKPFSCDKCGKKFTQSAHLKSHVSVHTGERPFACTLCSRSFIVKYSLRLHMKKCHPRT
ncbi:myoneurin-like [Parambassis ranga]|uniref:Myoneurin-like n=1 Tax=Parambassis ranga TaxID=210632 RepID=A0A6P7K1P1_9TELE|nr:myoneurin-like [Parambassis ranga]